MSKYIFHPITLEDLMEMDSLCSSSDCQDKKGHQKDSTSSLSSDSSFESKKEVNESMAALIEPAVVNLNLESQQVAESPS